MTELVESIEERPQSSMDLESIPTNLTRGQYKYLAIFTQFPTKKAAIEELGFNYSILYEWRSRTPGFREAEKVVQAATRPDTMATLARSIASSASPSVMNELVTLSMKKDTPATDKSPAVVMTDRDRTAQQRARETVLSYGIPKETHEESVIEGFLSIVGRVYQRSKGTGLPEATVDGEFREIPPEG